MSLIIIGNCSDAQGQTFVGVGDMPAAASFVCRPDSLPSYVYVISDAANTSVSDSLFYAKAGRTIYPVNKMTLDPKSPLLKELEEKVLPLASTKGWTLEAIELRGAASPEGPYANNKRLSEGRARAMFNFLAKRLPASSTRGTRTQTVPEDYDYLLWLMEGKGDADAPLLKEIMERYRGDVLKIKAALQKAQGGKLWRRLVKEYYPVLRNARVLFFFTRDEEEPILSQSVAPVVPPPLDIECRVDNDMVIAVPDLLQTTVKERRHMLSLSSNLLYDAFYMPGFGWAPMLNIAAEFYPRNGKFTYRAAFTSPYYHRWSKHKFFQIRDYHLEVRRYFNPGFYHTGWYLGAYINANKYGIGLGAKKGWQGEGAGAALKAGYVVRLGRSRRWRIDFHVALGGYVTRHDPYIYGNPITGEQNGDYYYDWGGASEDFLRRNHRFRWLGPTEAGITVSYDFLFWRCSRAGVSFLNREYIR